MNGASKTRNLGKNHSNHSEMASLKILSDCKSFFLTCVYSENSNRIFPGKNEISLKEIKRFNEEKSVSKALYCSISNNLTLTLPLFLVGHDVGYYGPPFFPVGSNFCASVYVHSCISGDVSQPPASLPSSTAFAIYHAFCDYTL